MRHDEDREMWELTRALGMPHFADCKNAEDFMCTRAKALFLFAAQLRTVSRPVPMPNSDYTLDQHTVLENGVRFSAAAAELGMRLGCGLAQVAEIVRTVQNLVQGCSGAEDWVRGNVPRQLQRKHNVRSVRDAVRMDPSQIRDKSFREAVRGLPDPRVVVRARLEAVEKSKFTAGGARSRLELEISVANAGGPGVYRSPHFVKAKPYTYYLLAGRDEKV